MSNNELQLPFLKRFWIYQSERFPVIMNIIASFIFSFSVIVFSRVCRGASGFVDLKDYFISTYISFTLFFLVRIFDEFKDREEDAQFRPYLPVPRGLISFRELSIVGAVFIISQIGLILWLQPSMWLLYALFFSYLLLMRYEFFVPVYLKKHHFLYIGSHMLIIPLLDLYSSGIDWKLSNIGFHYGIILFMVVSYCNGLIVEFGRKMKATENEEEGVTSYTKIWGISKAVSIWLFTIVVTAGVAIFSGFYMQCGWLVLTCIALFIVPMFWVGLNFKKNPSKKSAKLMEVFSALWTVFMYLALGVIPAIYHQIY